MKICVVDSNRIARRFVVTSMGPLGHDVAELDPICLSQVLVALHENTPDLLISDLQMPTCPGLTLIRTCKEDPHLQAMKILILTAHDDEHLATFLQKIGEIGYLNKPVSPAVLAECVDRLMQAEAALPIAGVKGAKGRVAVVDDSGIMRAIMANHLNNHGFEAVEIDPKSLREGLQALLATRPRLILTDYLMPGFNGVDLARAFRQEAVGELANIPILLVTAHDSPELAATVADIGRMEVFPKPIDPEALSAKMEALLS